MQKKMIMDKTIMGRWSKCKCIWLKKCVSTSTLQWHHNEHDGVSNLRRLDCLLNPLYRRRSKLRVTGLYAGNSSVTGEFPAQKASNAEKVPIGWRHHHGRSVYVNMLYAHDPHFQLIDLTIIHTIHHYQSRLDSAGHGTADNPDNSSDSHVY